MKITYKFPMHTSQEKSTTTINSAKASGELCMACGLCCTGAIFSHVNISNKESKKLLEVSISSKDDLIEMNQPCSFFINGSCSVYEERPHKCSDYNCKLVKKVISGESSFVDAMEIVNITKSQVKWFSINIPIILNNFNINHNKNTSYEKNLRNNLNVIYKLFNDRLKNTEKPTFTTEEQEFCLNALDYIKGLAISFYTSSLLMKYNGLVMKMDSK